MKRSLALFISAGVTALILVAVLAVAAPKLDATNASAIGQDQIVTIVAPSGVQAASSDAAALQAQLAVMQQREAQYQQRLQQAYAQLQAAQNQPAGAPSGEHEEHEDSEHEGDH